MQKLQQGSQYTVGTLSVCPEEEEELGARTLGHSRYSINVCPEEEEGLGATLGDLSPELVRDVLGS